MARWCNPTGYSTELRDDRDHNALVCNIELISRQTAGSTGGVNWRPGRKAAPDSGMAEK